VMETNPAHLHQSDKIYDKDNVHFNLEKNIHTFKFPYANI